MKTFKGIPASIGFAVGKPIFHSDIGSATERFDEPRIFFARSLSAGEAESVNLARFQSLILEKGGQASHATIITRTRGIPAVIGVKLTYKDKKSTIIIDGCRGNVILEPDERTLTKYRILLPEYHDLQQQFFAEKDRPAITLDGHRVEPPTEGEQFQTYSAIAQIAKDAPVIIRILDIRGDKHPEYLKFPIESNPFLGRRGLRYSLSNPKIIKTQVSAILRAASRGNIKLMLPMVARIEEIDAFMEILRDVISDLEGKSGIEFNKDTQIGTMVEIPSAAEIVTKLGERVDFFSIGTNDLIQYLEAVDRTNELVADLFDPYHPAVFRLLSRIVNDAHDQGKWVGLCGEMAADYLAATALVGLGIDELSMAPGYIPMMKSTIRRMKKVVGTGCCEEILRARDSKEVTDLLRMNGPNVFESLYSGADDGTSCDYPVWGG